jgi:uncharacterized protein YdiU (UPF0061 family)
MPPIQSSGGFACGEACIPGEEAEVRGMQDEIAQAENAGWNWDHSYARLPGLLHESSRPQTVRAADVVVLNRALAGELGLEADVLGNPGYAGVFVGNRLPGGAEPIAQAYAGHQYGHFTGLGDGRAILLGEHLSPDGRRWDIQLKGSGRTRFSRGGDGRAALGPMLREYLMSEAMAALGIPTTRSLAVAATGEVVMREDPLPGAVLTRVAASHIRVGTFQWVAAHEDMVALSSLLEHTASRHFPEIDPMDSRGFFIAVMERQVALVVNWMRVGFIHGVMNTDNMALSGETIDYGPCAFMDAYDPDTVFSSIDRGGRYAYANQPSIARWNLARLAETLLPLFDEERALAADFANEVLGRFEGMFQNQWLAMMREKTGLLTEEADDASLIQDLLDQMHAAGADYTNTFRALCDDEGREGPFRAWQGRWLARLSRQPHPRDEVVKTMCAANPAVIPRNHLVQAALDAATAGDLTGYNDLLAVLASPYDKPAEDVYTWPPPAGSAKYVTYCGT